MPSFAALALFASCALGAVLPRVQSVPDGACCFTLRDTTSNKVIQQDKTNGNVYFDAGAPQGWYCINLSDSRDVLLDHLNNACIISIENRFLCLDPTMGVVSWTLDDSDGTALLAHDGETSYHACPNKSGGELLWGNDKKATGCRTVSLKAQGFKGTCPGLT